MDEFEALPELKMTALAVLFQTKWNSKKENKSNDFVVKEALATFASSLEDDDIGYFYDPKAPRDLCINPGELVGKIANSNLPYGFNFSKGVDHLVEILHAFDDDYSPITVVVSDCFTEDQVKDLMLKLEGFKLYVFSIGNCAVVDGVIRLKDACELSEALKICKADG